MCVIHVHNYCNDDSNDKHTSSNRNHIKPTAAPQAELTKRGLKDDRVYMIVDEQCRTVGNPFLAIEGNPLL